MHISHNFIAKKLAMNSLSTENLRVSFKSKEFNLIQLFIA